LAFLKQQGIDLSQGPKLEEFIAVQAERLKILKKWPDKFR